MVRRRSPQDDRDYGTQHHPERVRGTIQPVHLPRIQQISLDEFNAHAGPDTYRHNSPDPKSREHHERDRHGNREGEDVENLLGVVRGDPARQSHPPEREP